MDKRLFSSVMARQPLEIHLGLEVLNADFDGVGRSSGSAHLPEDIFLVGAQFEDIRQRQHKLGRDHCSLEGKNQNHYFSGHRPRDDIAVANGLQ